jgi:hypothetical protein
MSPVWVNGKFLDETPSKKIEKWKPTAKEERTVWSTCADCGQDIYKLDSCWPMPDKTVCVWGGCWEKYYAQGIGYHGCAGMDFELALES